MRESLRGAAPARQSSSGSPRAPEPAEASDSSEALDTILSEWIGLLTGNYPDEVDSLLSTLPEPLTEDPRILVVRACVQDSRGANSVAQMLLGRARSAARTRELPGLEWHLAFGSMLLLDDRQTVYDSSLRAWALLSEGVDLSIRSRTAALHHLGWAFLRHRGEPDQGIEILEYAMQEAGKLGDDVLRRRTARHLAFTLAWAGRLRNATRVLEEIDGIGEDVNDYAPWKLNTYGDAEAAIAYIAYWRNDVELAHSSVEGLESPEIPAISFAGSARMMLFLTAVGTRDEVLMRQARIELQEIPANDARGISWQAFKRMCIALIAEASGHRQQALSIARRFAQSEDLPLVTVALAGILRRCGRVKEALRMLNRLHRYQQISYVRVATLVTAAAVHHEEGHVAEAHDLCERALEIAAREDIRRPFCEGDSGMRQLLTSHMAWGTGHGAFITTCLSYQIGPGGLAVLSERERAVFAQLRTLQTIPEIAGELDVSVNTVKTQLRSIYKKLNVGSRREAVRRFLDEAH